MFSVGPAAEYNFSTTLSAALFVHVSVAQLRRDVSSPWSVTLQLLSLVTGISWYHYCRVLWRCRTCVSGRRLCFERLFGKCVLDENIAMVDEYDSYFVSSFCYWDKLIYILSYTKENNLYEQITGFNNRLQFITFLNNNFAQFSLSFHAGY